MRISVEMRRGWEKRGWTRLWYFFNSMPLTFSFTFILCGDAVVVVTICSKFFFLTIFVFFTPKKWMFCQKNGCKKHKSELLDVIYLASDWNERSSEQLYYQSTDAQTSGILLKESFFTSKISFSHQKLLCNTKFSILPAFSISVSSSKIAITLFDSFDCSINDRKYVAMKLKMYFSGINLRFFF